MQSTSDVLTNGRAVVCTVAPTLGKHDYGDKLVLKAQASAVIEIPFSASPEPSVEWKYKGGRLTDTRRFREETVPGMTSLSMSKVTKKDAGDYSMMLENALGKATFTIKLIVQGSFFICVQAYCSGSTRGWPQPDKALYLFIMNK